MADFKQDGNLLLPSDIDMNAANDLYLSDDEDNFAIDTDVSCDPAPIRIKTPALCPQENESAITLPNWRNHVIFTVLCLHYYFRSSHCLLGEQSAKPIGFTSKIPMMHFVRRTIGREES